MSTGMDAILERAREAYRAKYHCSEAVVLAVGEHYLSPLPELLVRVSCPFGGGIGGCRQEICGALSGGIILLGALWGRASSQENDEWLYSLVCRLRETFESQFGSSLCQPIRDTARDEKDGCIRVVEAGTEMVVRLIKEAIQERPLARS